MTISEAGSELLKRGFPKFMDQKGLQSVAASEVHMAGSEINSDE